MILRLERWGTELPPPSDPDPAGANAVQELMGGRFGEMSTLMNYTFQSFNFRGKQSVRPFYELIANIAAEEFGHIELVAATINTMLTGASEGKAPDAALAGITDAEKSPHHFFAGGQGALPQDSRGMPWTGDYVFSSGDLIEDLTHNFFLETGARQGKLKVYEAVEHPAARALTGYLLVRGGVHQIAYARALERLTGAQMSKLFPAPRIPTDKIPECQPHIAKGLHRTLYRFSPDDYKGGRGRLQRAAPRDGRGPRGRAGSARGSRADRPPAAAGRLRPGLRAGGDRRDRRRPPGAGGTLTKADGRAAPPPAPYL
jgi:Mn-containing catalase